MILIILKSLGKWFDMSCEFKTCAICNIKSIPVFQMRGLCYGTSFDQHYSWTGKRDKKTGRYYFQGFSNSKIQWNDDQKEWKLTLYQNKTIYGVCNETNGLYPFGTYDWHIFNDTCKVENSIHGSQFSKRLLSFSGWY